MQPNIKQSCEQDVVIEGSRLIWIIAYSNLLAGDVGPQWIGIGVTRGPHRTTKFDLSYAKNGKNRLIMRCSHIVVVHSIFGISIKPGKNFPFVAIGQIQQQF